MATKSTVPILKNPRARKPALAQVGRTPKRRKPGPSLAEYLAQASPDQEGTILERLLDGAAAEMGRAFDARQVTVRLAGGASTRIDRVNWNPKTAIYADGIQHELREETAIRDRMEDAQLEAMGWRVVRLGWRELLADAVRAVSRVWFW